MKIIILAGGCGNRLWPLTYPPKQFSFLFGEKTLFQKTLDRFLKQYKAEDFVIVTNKQLFDLAKSQAPLSLQQRIICEPESKNTAFALLYALEWLEKMGEHHDEFLVAPCDHAIDPEEIFLKSIEMGRERAAGHLLFGVTPTFAHTGYGYILADFSQNLPKVKTFIEKPDKEKAVSLLDCAGCLWNSGIFLFQTEKFFKDIGSITLKTVPPLSIDKVFLEHFEELFVVPLSVSWSDLGTWESLYEYLPKDERHNVLIGDVRAKECKNSLIISENKPLTIEGVDSAFIIQTEDGLLVRQRGEQVAMQLSSSIPAP